MKHKSWAGRANMGQERGRLGGQRACGRGEHDRVRIVGRRVEQNSEGKDKFRAK